MQSKTNPTNSSATLLSTINSGNSKKIETIGARLVAFSSRSSSFAATLSSGVEHVYVPRPDLVPDWLFETGSILFKIIALLLQYLLIYKSEKWQGPYHSPTVSIIQWSHIDYYLLAILIIFCLSNHRKLLILRVSINFLALLYSFRFYSWRHFLVFTYPLFCRILISHDQNNSQRSSTGISTSNPIAGHWCSNNASDLRYETECLRQDFNRRIRLILFTAFLNTYYICLVPIVYCDINIIRFDHLRLFLFALTLFLSFLMMTISYSLPLELLTVLHRNSQHLGSWDPISTHPGPMIALWDEKNPSPYEPNSLVRHKRQVYRSCATCSTAAEPGNASHKRFARLFTRPMLFPLILFSIQVFLLILQCLCLFFDRRWFVHLAQMIVFLFNTYTIRRTARDMFLLYFVYGQD